MAEKTSGNWRRWGRLIGGWALIAAGVLGCVLPILPGIPFLLGGLALLAVDYPWAKRWLDWMKAQVARLRGKSANQASKTNADAEPLHVTPQP